MRLNHVSLTVADRERSAAFYGEHFGLTARVHEDERRLILGEPDDGGGAGSLLALCEGTIAAPEVPSDNHFGFRVATGEQVRAARERFRAAGITESEWQDSHGFVRVQVFDPDGYGVEVYAY